MRKITVGCSVSKKLGVYCRFHRLFFKTLSFMSGCTFRKLARGLSASDGIVCGTRLVAVMVHNIGKLCGLAVAAVLTDRGL